MAIGRTRASSIVVFTCLLLPGIPDASEGVSESISLQPVVITATGAEQRISRVPASVTVVEGERLKERPARDLLELIRDVPGLSLSGVGLSGRRTIRLRGLESHQSLLLVDGKRTSPSDAVIGHSDFQHAWVPPDAIKRIEVIRGPMSALYGSDAMGGVINIVTHPVPEHWSGSASLLGGARDDGRGGERGQLGFRVGGPLMADTLGMRLHGSFHRQEDSAQPDDRRLTEIEGRSSLAGGLELAWTPDHRNTIRLQHDRGEEERWRDTLHRGGEPIHESRYDIERRHWSISHDGRYGPLGTQLRAYRSSLEQTSETDTSAVEPSERQKLIDDVLDAHLRFPVGKAHLVTLGGEYRDETLEHPALNRGKTSLNHRALFLQDEWMVADWLTLTLGTRVDRHELFGTENSPRVYINVYPTDSITLKAGYGEGFRAPTIKQISPEYSFDGPHSFRGNPDLKPEQVRAYEVGFEYWRGNLSAGATAFRSDVKDLLANRCATHCEQPLGRVFEHVNIDEARIVGVESFLDRAITSSVSLTASHTWLDTEDRETGRNLPERPRHAAALRLAWAGPQSGWRAHIRGNYTGRQVVFADEARETLAGYTLWAAGGGRSFGRHTTVRASIENLTDKRPQEKNPLFNYPEQGRTYFLTFEAEY